MRIVAIMNRFLILSCVLCCFSACSRKEADGGKGKQAFPPQRFSGDLKVRIIPEPATAATDLQATYTNGGVVTFSWERNGQPVQGGTGPTLSKGMFVRGDTIVAVVKANGREGRATVTIVNSPPRVQSVTVDPVNIHAGTTITASATAMDVDGDDVDFEFIWIVNGNIAAERTSTLSGNKFKKGDQIILQATPFDDLDTGPEFASRPIVVPPGLPEIVSTPPALPHTGIFVYDVKAVHPDGDIIIYSLGSVPSGMTINSKTGRLEWRIEKVPPGVYTVEVIAQDSLGSRAVQGFTLPVTETEGRR